MRKIKQIVMVITFLSLSVLLFSCASFNAEDRISAKVMTGTFANQGDTVHLFYAMSRQAKEEFCPDAVVPVYRMGKGYYIIKTEVGKIKVIKNLGDHYIEAIVVEGKIMPNDIAMQPNSECLIRLPEPETD